MEVSTIRPGRFVRVHPGGVSAQDVLELAEALIREEGWRGRIGTATEGGSGTQAPWTIHQAIGEAARRIGAAESKSDETVRGLRERATALFEQTHGAGSNPPETEFQINDRPGLTKDGVLRLLREARGLK